MSPVFAILLFCGLLPGPFELSPESFELLSGVLGPLSGFLGLSSLPGSSGVAGGSFLCTVNVPKLSSI